MRHSAHTVFTPGSILLLWKNSIACSAALNILLYMR